MALRRAEQGRMLMKPERWQRITDLFHEPMTRGPEERIAFLEEACQGDERLAPTGRAARQSHETIG